MNQPAEPADPLAGAEPPRDPALLWEWYTTIWQAKREWESIMDCLNEMVLLIDEKGLVRRCNQGFACFLNKPYEDIHGRSLDELLDQAGLILEAGREGAAEYSHPASGRVFCCQNFPFAAEYTEIQGMVVTMLNVTRQQQTEIELQRKNQQLTKAYRELQKSQAKLLQQEKLASIGQLAAGVAHEINNPVGFVTSNLGTMGKYLARLREFIEHQERLLSGDLSGGREEAAKLRRQMKIDFTLDDAADLLRESLDGVERVKVIVQNLKRFSRLDQAQSCHGDINQCLEDTFNIIWNELKYKVTLHKEYGELPPTFCHPQQLNQVFMNLLLNAAQAIDKQGEIRIKTWREGDDIFITIADTGSGIAPEHLGRLFDPFFTTKEVGKGTGLGLSIVYDIVKQHGGEITVDSEPGRGSTFRVRLPIREEDS